MKDLISVIVPVYNVEKYIKQCIDSIINQTYNNLEIILVDDGSSDNSGKICDEYAEIEKKIKVIHKENAGVSSARNIGLVNATGEFITFVDADDYISIYYCERMLNKLKQEKVECVVCGYNRVYSQKVEKVIEKEKYALKSDEFLSKIMFVQNGFGFCNMKLWKKSTIEHLKFNEYLKVGEDAFFCIQACENVKNFYVLNEPLYNYRFNDESLVRKFDDKYVEKYLIAMKLTKEYIEYKYKNDLNMQKKINNYIAYHVLLIVINYCFNPKNDLNTSNQIHKLKEVCNIKEFKESIEKFSYNTFSITRKITLFTLKYKLYFFTMVIGKIRQKQFRKK